MRREELVMDVLGELDDRLIAEALPKNTGNEKGTADNENKSVVKTDSAPDSGENIDISNKAFGFHIAMRVLGIAAALALVVGGGVWLWQNWDKIAVREPDRPGVVTTVSEPIATEPPNGKYDPAFDMLGKAYFDTDGAFRISDEDWSESQDYDTFKKYFYGVWDNGQREVVLDDSEQSEFAQLALNCFLKGIYRSGESTLIFCMGGSAESSIWWLDMNDPVTMYRAGGSPGEFPNGIYLYDSIPNIAEYSRTDKEINEPENGYLSVIRQLELAAEHGFPLGLITDIETEYNNITINHDARYYAYPVYLISESDDRIVLKTTLGKMYDAIGNVTYSIQKNQYGVWERTIDELSEVVDNPEENEIAKYLKADYTRSVQMSAREVTTGSLTLIYELTGKYKDKFYLKSVSGYELENLLSQDREIWNPYDRDNSWKTMLGESEEITITSTGDDEYISFPFERIVTDGMVEMRQISLPPGQYRIRKPLHAYSTETDEEIAVFNAYAYFNIYYDTPNILGITMSVKDVFSDLGLTLEIKQGNYDTDRYMGQITYDHQYTITGYSEETGWDYVPYKSEDTTPETIGINETREEWIDWSGLRALRYGRYRVEKTFYDTDPVSGRKYSSVTSYAYFDIRPQQQTFDVKYYYLNDLAGIAAGYAPPFQSSPHDIYADGTGWEWIGYADCKGFFTSDHDKFPNEVPAELVDILKQYADGDDLNPDLGGNFAPITERYHILSNNETYPSGDGIISYRIGYMPGNDFLITMGWDNKILVFRENTKYTAARRVIELLWANSNPSFEVFAVLDSNNGERVEYLMIVASENYFALGEEERYSALERVKSILTEHNMLDDDLIKFMSPEQLRDTWIPVEIIDDTGRLNDSMIRVADRVFRLVNNETMDFEEYKKFLADNGVIAPDASRGEIFGLGNRVTPYRDMFDILDIEADESYDFWDYSQITDEIIHSTAFDADTNYVWSYDKPLSQAVLKVVHLRMLQELCPQIKKIDFVVGSEPDEYRIIVHANKADQEILKNNEAFKMFYDPEITEFTE